MVQKQFPEVVEYLERMVEEEHIPGIVVGVTTAEQLIYKETFGYAHYHKKIKMTEDTLFDLASLTKVVATLPAILQLLEAGMLDLDDSIYYYFPELEEYHHDVTIKHLLTHTSGFQPEYKFYLENIKLQEVANTLAKLKRKKAGREVIYSDLNFILLGMIVELLTQQSLATYTTQSIYKPLGMSNTSYNPPRGELQRIAATEFRQSLNDYQWGTVHDENAFHFGGVSGHAGLFSTMEDLSIFARMLLNNGEFNGKRLLSPKTIALSIASFTKHLSLNRGLGWQLYDDSSSFSGQFLQDGFGHTGFTGTSIWNSKDCNYAVVLLTNRVHFGRGTNINRMRRIVHNLIALAMD